MLYVIAIEAKGHLEGGGGGGITLIEAKGHLEGGITLVDHLSCISDSVIMNDAH